MKWGTYDECLHMETARGTYDECFGEHLHMETARGTYDECFGKHLHMETARGTYDDCFGKHLRSTNEVRQRIVIVFYLNSTPQPKQRRSEGSEKSKSHSAWLYKLWYSRKSVLLNTCAWKQ